MSGITAKTSITEVDESCDMYKYAEEKFSGILAEALSKEIDNEIMTTLLGEDWFKKINLRKERDKKIDRIYE